MISRVHRRALLQWLAVTGLSLPLLSRAPLAAEPGAETRSLESFLDVFLQRLFPHSRLDLDVYREVAVVFTGAVEANPGFAGLVRAGRAELDTTAGVAWLALDETTQIASLKAREATPFFQALRSLGGLLFYNTPAVWSLLGYEGPSFDKGGYLARGFDDIDWLPDSADAR